MHLPRAPLLARSSTRYHCPRPTTTIAKAKAQNHFTNHGQYRTAATATATASTGKQEGTIADSFASLSGLGFAPLEARYASIKADLIQGNEEAITASWHRLLDILSQETKTIAQLGSAIIPSIDFSDLSPATTSNPDSNNDTISAFSSAYRHHGVALIRSVLPIPVALDLKSSLQSYIRANPSTKAFPQSNPQVYELYWSPSQIRARSHPSLLAAQKFLLGHWHSADSSALVSSEPIAYADRLRIRQPGDALFALGPHVDGGSVERWEPAGYGGKEGVYSRVFASDWERYDPWESSCRLPVASDLYQGAGACSAFRMAQGWLSMSTTAPGEGTLLVNPLLRSATAYMLLRPFFAPRRMPKGLLEGEASRDELSDAQFLDRSNWVLETPTSSWLHGATPGRGQELNESLHPHLRLRETMVHVPTVNPGDYVVWHCDTIHAVDKVHSGTHDSSVLYIPACPLTEQNAHYLARQREAFLQGVPSPDFPGGVGESLHQGRPGAAAVAAVSEAAGMQAMGLERWDCEREGMSPGEREVMRRSNEILGF